MIKKINDKFPNLKLHHILWVLTPVLSALIAMYWLIPAAIFTFLILVPITLWVQFGKEKILEFYVVKKYLKVLVGLYVAALVLAPPMAEPFFRTYGGFVTKDWDRELNPKKLYVIWAVEKAGTGKTKKLINRWNPLAEVNVNNKKVMLSAAWLKGIQADVLIPFDTTEIEPNGTFTLIIFESIQVEKEIPPENPEDEPKTKQLTRLKVTFITPSHSGEFNKYTTVLSALDQSVLDFISTGLSQSMAGKGEKIKLKELEKIAQKTGKITEEDGG